MVALAALVLITVEVDLSKIGSKQKLKYPPTSISCRPLDTLRKIS